MTLQHLAVVVFFCLVPAGSQHAPESECMSDRCLEKEPMRAAALLQVNSNKPLKATIKDKKVEKRGYTSPEKFDGDDAHAEDNSDEIGVSDGEVVANDDGVEKDGEHDKDGEEDNSDASAEDEAPESSESEVMKKGKEDRESETEDDVTDKRDVGAAKEKGWTVKDSEEAAREIRGAVEKQDKKKGKEELSLESESWDFLTGRTPKKKDKKKDKKGNNDKKKDKNKNKKKDGHSDKKKDKKKDKK